MAQDLGQQSNEPEETGERESTKRSSIWPWILLALVVLIVILLIWWYWRQPQASVTVIEKSTEIPIVVPEPRPEPIIPTATLDSQETSAVPLVPDVMGERQGSAAEAIRDAGYAVTTSRRYTTSKVPGLVIGQNPAGGMPLELGGTVAITVSAGTPAVSKVKMPQTVGLSQASAESKVKAAGLIPYITYGTVGPVGHVISQWPPAGEMIPAGSEAFIQVRLNK